jgi:hypothetical protein
MLHQTSDRRVVTGQYVALNEQSEKPLEAARNNASFMLLMVSLLLSQRPPLMSRTNPSTLEESAQCQTVNFAVFFSMA